MLQAQPIAASVVDTETAALVQGIDPLLDPFLLAPSNVRSRFLVINNDCLQQDSILEWVNLHLLLHGCQVIYENVNMPDERLESGFHFDVGIWGDLSR